VIRAGYEKSAANVAARRLSSGRLGGELTLKLAQILRNEGAARPSANGGVLKQPDRHEPA